MALACSLTGWLVQAKTQYGDLSVDSTGSNYPMLVGNVVSLLAPAIFVPILSFTLPTQVYDWVSMAMIRKGDDSDMAADAHVDIEQVPGERENNAAQEAEEKVKLARASKIARSLTVFLTIALLVLWPMPMYGTGYIFSKSFFTGWVSVGILWLFCSSFCVGLYPLYEGRKTSSRTIKSIFLDITGKGRPALHGRAAMMDSDDNEEKVDAKKAPTPPELEVAAH